MSSPAWATSRPSSGSPRHAAAGSTFTDPAFLLELCPGSSHGSGHHHRARLLGVFVQDKSNLIYRRNKEMVQARMTTMAAPPPQRASSDCLAPIFLPALGSPLAPTGRALTSFVGGGVDDGTFDYAQLLAARRGIVLLQLAPRTPKEKDSCHLFAVCNPVTGDRHVLPPLEWNLADGCRTWGLVGYAIITAADDSSSAGNAGSFTFSQLLVITQDGHRDRNAGFGDARIHRYSAATRRWSAPTTCLDRRVFTLVGAESAVVHGGAAHWRCVDDGRLARSAWERVAARGGGDDHHHLYKLSVDVATADVFSLTRLPVRVARKQLLCVNSDDDKLVVASVYPVHVTVWTPPGGGTGDGGDGDDTTRAAAAEWPRTSFRITPHYNGHEKWFDFNHGSLLVMFRGGRRVFILDLHTKVMEEVSIIDVDNNGMGFLAAAKRYQTCVPYEMDLVEFFTLQLGSIRERLAGTTTTSETESP